MSRKPVIKISAQIDVNNIKRPVIRRLVAESLKNKDVEIGYREYDKYQEYANTPDHWERAPEPPQHPL